jgi:CRISPR-associated protein Cas5h
MKGLQLTIDGNWAHFKKPETNNNPLTHDFITKTAFIGLIGAVLGKERNEMRVLFPRLCDDLLYGVRIIRPVKKESWGFTMRYAVDLLKKAPKQMELLKTPAFHVAVALYNSRSKELFDEFRAALMNTESKYTPVLGLHNCPANVRFEADGEFSEKQSGQFKARCMVSNKHILNVEETRLFRLGFERIPTFQNDNFWNLPDRYVEVVYPSENNEIAVTGDYYQFSDGECWWLI